VTRFQFSFNFGARIINSKYLFCWKIINSMEYSSKIKNKTNIIPVIAATIAIFSVALVLTTVVHSGISSSSGGGGSIIGIANAQSSPMNSTLFVSGSASNQTKPDRVTVSLGVETTNETAEEALASNSDLMNKVLNALKAAGVQENETSTSTFSITPNYNFSADTNEGRLIGFTVTNSIQIQSGNIENVSKWIDTAVTSGANNVNSISFSLSDSKMNDIRNSLLKDAIDNAKAKADIAAGAAGLKVIGVKSINVEDSGSLPPPMPVPFAKSFATAEAASPPTPIVAGEQEVSVSVSMIYLIG
jgi:uncharacterized protein YggE